MSDLHDADILRLPAPGVGRRELIDRPDRLALAVEELLQAPIIGIDIETFYRAREKSQLFCLAQLAIPGACFLIDPLRLPDLAPLRPILANPRILKVFYALGSDRQQLTTAGLSLISICDIAEVARSAYGEQAAGLANLARQAFFIGLDKSFQRSDWSKRPLSPPMIAYAARDAEITLALYTWIQRVHPDLVKLHTISDSLPDIPAHVASWLVAALRGFRQRPLWDFLAEAGISFDNEERLTEQCRIALEAIRDPNLRVRLVRIISDLDLYQLGPELVPLLTAPSALERAAAVRCLGRLKAYPVESQMAALLDDPVADVARAAAWALEALSSPEPDPPMVATS